MAKYINNTSRLCVAPMPEADVFAKEHFAEGFPRAKDAADAFKRLQDDLYAQGLITMEGTTLNVERPASCESALRGPQHQPID